VFQVQPVDVPAGNVRTTWEGVLGMQQKVQMIAQLMPQNFDADTRTILLAFAISVLGLLVLWVRKSPR